VQQEFLYFLGAESIGHSGGRHSYHLIVFDQMLRYLIPAWKTAEKFQEGQIENQRYQTDWVHLTLKGQIVADLRPPVDGKLYSRSRFAAWTILESGIYRWVSTGHGQLCRANLSFQNPAWH
jgi:hypothetical protein